MTRSQIRAKLRELYRRGKPMHRAEMLRSHQTLLAAAIREHGSYAAAVQHAGIFYEAIKGRPKWTRQKIIALLKQARREEKSLHWSAAISPRSKLRTCAHASIRLFGSWARALGAAGVDEDEVTLRRTWNKSVICFDLKQRHANGEHLSSGWIQHENPALHAAIRRYFGSFDHALREARLKPEKCRLRQPWTPARVRWSLHAWDMLSLSERAMTRRAMKRLKMTR